MHYKFQALPNDFKVFVLLQFVYIEEFRLHFQVLYLQPF